MGPFVSLVHAFLVLFITILRIWFGLSKETNDDIVVFFQQSQFQIFDVKMSFLFHILISLEGAKNLAFVLVNVFST